MEAYNKENIFLDRVINHDHLREAIEEGFMNISEENSDKYQSFTDLYFKFESS
jgi:hypothetical protein